MTYDRIADHNDEVNYPVHRRVQAPSTVTASALATAREVSPAHKGPSLAMGL